MPALLFGSISSLADTSELQRQAFNEAFETHGLDWKWEQEDYRALLGRSGGRDRVAEYAQAAGQTVDADAVHATKSEIFQKLLGEADLSPRPGVVDAMRESKSQGYELGFITTTSPENVSALLTALGDKLGDDFDLVTDVTTVKQPKPDKAAYAYALEQLGESAGECVAIEDNPGGVEAAKAAGVACIAFPNENTGALDFGPADRRVDALTFADVASCTSSGPEA